MCDSNKVEDEVHFLISCNAFMQREVNYMPMYQFLSNVNMVNELSLEAKLTSDPNICAFTARAYHDMLINGQAILYK